MHMENNKSSSVSPRERPCCCLMYFLLGTVVEKHIRSRPSTVSRGDLCIHSVRCFCQIANFNFLANLSSHVGCAPACSSSFSATHPWPVTALGSPFHPASGLCVCFSGVLIPGPSCDGFTFTINSEKPFLIRGPSH